MEQRMKMLIESVNMDNVEYLVEGADTTHWQDKTYKLKGVFMEAENKNRNGRIYPRSIMEKEITRYMNEEVKEGRSTSSLEHPKEPQVKLSEASHLITNLKMDGNLVYGEAKVLSTFNGRELKALIHDGVKFGMSSRALGSLGAGNVVQENFRLMGVDAVQTASAYAATVVESLVENFEYIISGDTIVQVAVDKFKKDLANHGSRQLAEDLEKFLNQYKQKY